MKCVATKTAEQLDLQALHRVRERLVSQRTGIINQIRAFMLERGIAVCQPPKAAFVTRLQPCRLPGRTARQLPDQSTTLWVESSSTSDPRLRGALPTTDVPASFVHLVGQRKRHRRRGDVRR